MSNALELLYERLTKKEEEARSIYMLSLQEQRNFEKQLDALNQYRSIYSSELVNKGMQGGMTTSTYSHFTSFINRLDNISSDQLQGLFKIKEETSKKLAFYKELEAKRKGLEMLMEKRRLQKLALQNKQEQKMSDDLSTNRYFQNQQNNEL